MNKATYYKIKSEADAFLARLADDHPDVFILDKSRAKIPLKVGIYKDIRKLYPDVSGRVTHFALKRYTSKRSYYRAILSGYHRYDLSVTPSGKVTAKQRDTAKERLKRSLISRSKVAKIGKNETKKGH
ncbi:ProQ/FINO family protein [Roseibium aggregatum]|uniref:ProP expression regulator n=1 Tax=Roseibium aggregatum TaxID=187304 RepID=A0A0M6Y6L1_9HYPH|nr:ProQ/FINO family protein [Roseibium aggregatum]CTQ45746.1 ProP expression regulator [Roseibium aggregatum]